jgi:hypothetical protein
MNPPSTHKQPIQKRAIGKKDIDNNLSVDQEVCRVGILPAAYDTLSAPAYIGKFFELMFPNAHTQLDKYSYQAILMPCGMSNFQMDLVNGG